MQTCKIHALALEIQMKMRDVATESGEAGEDGGKGCWWMELMENDILSFEEAKFENQGGFRKRRHHSGSKETAWQWWRG